MSALVCPSCGSGEALAEIDLIEGKCIAVFIERAADGSVDADFDGYTEILWDTQKPSGEWWCDTCDSSFKEEQFVTSAEYEAAGDKPDWQCCAEWDDRECHWWNGASNEACEDCGAVRPRALA